MKNTFAALALAAAVTAGTGIGSIVAQAASPDQTVNGCFANDTGQLRVLVPSNNKCDNTTETPLSWNLQQQATRWYADADGDGYGDWYRFVDSPAQPPGYVDSNSDCNDNNPNAHPGVASDPGPGDLDCNGVEAQDQVITWYRDHDGDGFGVAGHDLKAPRNAEPAGYVYRYGDCNDSSASVYPYHGSCHSSVSGSDIDGDGHRAVHVGGDDCNDFDAHEYPGNTEVVDTHGHDEDCDPSTGYVLPYDPLFLDSRPHGFTFRAQPYFNSNGHLANPGNITVGVAATGAHAIWATPPVGP